MTKPSIDSSPVSGHVSASYVALLFDWLAQAHPAVLAEMPYTRPAAGELNRVPVHTWRTMLDWVAARLGCSSFTLEVASHVKLANTGLLGYVASCCATVGEAFARLQQFEHLVYSINALQVHSEGGDIHLRWGIERGRPGHCVDTLAVAVLLAFTRTLLDKPFPLTRVCFVNPRPEQVLPYEQYFGCPVLFDQPWTELCLPADTLTWPLRAPDAVMQRILDQQAHTLLAQVRMSDEALPGLRRAIQDCLSAGQPNLEAVAKRLCLSGRTLQRKLQMAGACFRGELDSVRLEIAKNCLHNDSMGLSDLASYLGYADQSAFTHAFVKQTGVSPARYRKAGRSENL
ncbi:MAG: AraC family transcriptional regulator [Limnobacter sp.]|uniref:AraC family transcriptional regulator n=1 Tax=Limnobacter sp. TaxID=2003368 RepID=UPI00391B6547